MSNGKFDANSRAETTLELLDAVAEDGEVSQRNLARRLGVALGLTNAVLKRCVKKGLLKIQQVPAKRYAYYLTPKGFAEKSRLTAEYLSSSLQFYRTAREEYTELFRYCETREWSRVALIGTSDLAEIASLAAPGSGVEIVGILDPGRNEAAFGDQPVFQSLEDIEPARRPKAVILTDITDPQSAYDRLAAVMPVERILSPRLMRITLQPGASGQKKGSAA
ncbi:MAG: winged helix-turn-helix transcriptional regulator [Rhodospirillales bacterium]